jgi:hypothetical protein
MPDFLGGGDSSSSLLGTVEDAFAMLAASYKNSAIIQERGSSSSTGSTIAWIQGSLVAGLCGAIAMAPVSFCHHFDYGNLQHSVAQWQFTLAMGSIQAGVFAMVYRYALRQNDEHPRQIHNQVVGAFTAVRTLANLYVSDSSTSFDWNLLNQICVQGLESAVLFGAAGLALDVGFQNGWLSKLVSSPPSSSWTEEHR